MTDNTAPNGVIHPLLAQLETATDRDVVGVLEDALGRLEQDDPDDSQGLCALTRGLVSRLYKERLRSQAQLQKARFVNQHMARAMMRDMAPERLTGAARAMGLELCAALKAVPGRRRKALFSTQDYLRLHPDVAAAGADAVAHYLASGAEEGRVPADLYRRHPECFAARPDNLQDLGAAPPGLVAEFPDALRQEALARAGAQQARISVIMPSWNRAHVIGEALGSALLQSVAPSEVIVVDDGSSDGTAEMIRTRFADLLEEGRLIFEQIEHGGVSAARNAGLARARGDIIAYLDSDNIWDSDHLLFASTALEADKGIRAAYTALCRHNLTDGWSDILFQPFDRAALEQENYIDLNSFVHHRSLYEEQGGFDTRLSRLVDWDLILRYCADEAPVGVPVITGHYFVDRKGLGNITTTEEAAPNIARIRAKMQAAPANPGPSDRALKDPALKDSA